VNVAEERSGIAFSGFVISLVTTAAVHFGDYPDPMTGETKPPNLEGAAQMIDILVMIQEKTRGNLTAQERSLLEQVLYELRIRYVAATGGTNAPTPSVAS